jgi:hypothetical protein
MKPSALPNIALIQVLIHIQISQLNLNLTLSSLVVFTRQTKFEMPAKNKNIKLQLAGQQTLPFVRKYIVHVGIHILIFI